MNEHSCLDPEVGRMLHAFELGILTEQESVIFEQHLLRCEHCFQNLSAFQAEAEALTRDNAVQEMISELATTTGDRGRQRETFWRKLWPKTSLIYKPAVYWLLIVLLAYPAYLGIRQSSQREPKAVQGISLFPVRSAGLHRKPPGRHR